MGSLDIKQVYDLRPADLVRYPIWAYLSEDDPEASDEGTVKGQLPESFDFETMYVAAAEFCFPDGEVRTGFVAPDPGGLGFSQPCMFVGTESVTFWSGIRIPSSEELAQAYDTMGRGPESAFPIVWRCLHTPDGVPMEGTIEGFGYITIDDTEVHVRR